METQHKCAQCQRELDVGLDAVKVDTGVMGMKGFVPLETLLFCCDKCLSEYYDLSDLPSVPKRIP